VLQISQTKFFYIIREGRKSKFFISVTFAT